MDFWNDQGIIPMLLNSFSSTPIVGPSTTAAKPAIGAAPVIDINNPSAELLRQAKQLFGNVPADQLPAYIKANPETFKTGPGMGNPYQSTATKGDIGEALSKLAGLGGPNAAGQTPFGSAKPTLAGNQPYAPPAAMPAVGGGGPMQGGIGPVTPTTMSMALRPGAAPLGPAALNPFILAMLKSRLGVQ